MTRWNAVFAYDFALPPMAGHGSRAASELEAATIEVGGAELMFAMTTVGDGFSRVYPDHDDAENP